MHINEMIAATRIGDGSFEIHPARRASLVYTHHNGKTWIIPFNTPSEARGWLRSVFI